MSKTRALVIAGLLLLQLPLHGQVGRSVPREGYYYAKREFYAGQYLSAEKGFRQSIRSGLRIGTTRWIDAICYYSMLGELYFHRGQLEQSLELHEQAINWHLSNGEWLARLRYPTISPTNRPIRAAIGWGTRPTTLGEFPDSMSSLEGTLNLETPFQVGGAVNPAHMRSVDAVEVVRCLAMSLKRRAELLGPTSPLSSLGSRITNSFSNLSAPTGHWSAAWIEVLYGLALLGQGDRQGAMSHLRIGTTAGSFDHPLTGIALLEQGKYLLSKGEYAGANVVLHQASVAAAQFGQAEVVEEAFRYLTDSFLANAGQGTYPSISAAMAYAEREDFFRLAASLRLNAAEVAYYGNDNTSAGSLLGQARVIMGRQQLLATDLGAQLSYLDAINQYRSGSSKAANQSIKAALAYMQAGSVRRYHLAIIESLYAQGRRAVSPRQMEVLYSRILREPSDRDWRVAPLESITMSLSPHTGSLERWFELLVARKEYGRAIRVAEQLRRHRFYSSLPFGGRILSLRWLVDGGSAMLGKSGVQRQNELRQSYPQLAKLSRDAQKLQAKLRTMPMSPTDEDKQREQRAYIKQLISVSGQQEAMVRELALRREPAKLVFPPQPSLSAVQRAIQPNQAILLFVTTSQGWHAWFLRRETDEHWPIRRPQKIRRSIASLLKSFGNRNANHDVGVNDLQDDNWKREARQIWLDLIGELPRDGWNELEELVIIPDGVLWYLPFEALQVPAEQLADQEEDQSLISLVRLRYSPTASLSVGDKRGHNPKAKTTIVGGKLAPKDSNDYVAEMLAELKKNLPSLEVISRRKPPASAGYLGGLLDRLIVWNDIPLRGPYGWSPAQFDRGGAHSQLADWMEYPWGAPDQIILPGFHTAAESSLAKNATGHEVFLTACALLSTGTRTALVSRWRTGGKSPAVLVREFTKRLPEASASAAWQEAVRALREETVDPKMEPRVRGNRDDGELAADHPFFWGGYLLIDTGADPGDEAVVPTEAAPADDAAPPEEVAPPLPEKVLDELRSEEADPPAEDEDENAGDDTGDPVEVDADSRPS